MANRLKWWIPLTSIAVLGAAASQEAWIPGPEVADGYHAKVRAAAETFGTDFGAWHGADCPIPEAASALLNPNVVISRNYMNATSGEQVSVLVVQCRQSRDMDGHFPPNCYPGAGWRLMSLNAQTWEAGELAIPGTEYEFQTAAGGQQQKITVRDFFLLPDGRLFSTLSTFRRAAANFGIRPYGAAQIQVIFRGETSEAERDAAFGEFTRALRPLIDAIRTGKTT